MDIYELRKLLNKINYSGFTIVLDNDKNYISIKVGTCYSYNHVNTKSWINDEDLTNNFNDIIDSIKQLFHYSCLYDYVDRTTGKKVNQYSDIINEIEILKIK